jgi:hypothetical protein
MVGSIVKLLTGLLLVSGLAAQDQPTLGIVHGILSERSGSDLRVKTREEGPLLFRVNEQSAIERDRMPVALDQVFPGASIEIFWEGTIEGVRYARLVKLLGRQLLTSRTLFPYGSLSEHIAPRGSMVVTGIVLLMGSDRLVLRTRGEGQQSLMLRRDTRYKGDGRLVEATALAPATRVFIRAGKNLDGQLEAYEVVWGQILEPERP